jgi:hypothetical protein
LIKAIEYIVEKFREEKYQVTQEIANRIFGENQINLNAIFSCALKCKHYGFHEEKEYRISYILANHENQNNEKKLEFYNSNNLIRSFVKFGEGKILYAIEEIIIGPSKNKNQNQEKVQAMIFQKGLQDKIKMVRVSEIPFI